MRIESLVLKGVGPFDELHLEFPVGTDPANADVRVLVGPNASGKTTILTAIAQFFSARGIGLYDRMRDADSWAALRVDGRWEVLTKWGQASSPRDFELPGDSVSLQPVPRTSAILRLDRYVECKDSGPRRYSERVYNVLQEPANLEDEKFDFAVFFHSGLRQPEPYTIKSIEAIAIHPLSESLSPIKQNSVAHFLQWVANTITRRALALMRGDDGAAHQKSLILGKVEALLSGVTEGDISFELRDEPHLEVQLIWNGRHAQLATLPEGVKGLMAWIGDLMMRLDRLPWHESLRLRPAEAPMLVLLDEVGIHLHPGWHRLLVPTIQALLPNAQLFISTHSPDVVASATDGYIYALQFDGRRRAGLRQRFAADTGLSHDAVYREILGVRERFDIRIEKYLDRVRELRNQIAGGEGDIEAAFSQFEDVVRALAERSEEASRIADRELRQARKLRGL